MGTNKKEQEVKQTPKLVETKEVEIDQLEKSNQESEDHDDFIDHEKRVSEFLNTMNSKKR